MKPEVVRDLRICSPCSAYLLVGDLGTAMDTLLRNSEVLTAWLVGQERLGEKMPREGFTRLKFCPVCPAGAVGKAPLCSSHVLQV